MAFDYRLTLPAFVEAICIRLTILAAIIPSYMANAEVITELQNLCSAFESYFTIIRDGIVEFRPPTYQELADDRNPAAGPDSWLLSWTGRGGDLFGAVERYSTVHIVDHWPLTEYPFPNPNPAGIPGAPPDPHNYTKFLIRHLVRTMSRWKQVYNKVGLPAMATFLVQLKTLSGVSPARVTGPNGDWSLREVAKRLAAIQGSGITNGSQPISLKEVLQILQTYIPPPLGPPVNPPPYLSLRAALAQ